jgi:DNA polymerase III subunit alpha
VISLSSFVHLHVHSEYSLRESTLRISELLDFAVSEGADAIAVTDTNVMSGAVQFYLQAKARGIRPILGVQLTVALDKDVDTVAQGRPGGPQADVCVLLAENFAGYQALVRLVSKAQTRERRPVVSLSELGAETGNLIALVGGGESLIQRLISAGRTKEAAGWWQAWVSTWPNTDLYLDVQDHGLTTERQSLPVVLQWAKRDGISAVATNDVHYLTSADADTQRVLASMDGHDGPALRPGQRYELAAMGEMERRLGQVDGAIENTRVIAGRCHVELPVDTLRLPVYPVEAGATADEVLRRAATVGVQKRYGGQVTTEIRNRLDYELSVISRLGYADYFLVVADFIRFAHREGISTGPGRGSAAGSLVAYALRITDVDPIAGGLLFERFLNPERVSWPDIDTDFEFERRSEVIQYVARRYGVDHVAQIGTFGTLAARAAIRDVGRALHTEPKLVDKLARLIPGQPGMTLKQAREEVPDLSRLLTDEPSLGQLWQTAVKLEGLPRHTSTHAAGVVIAPTSLIELVPLMPGQDGVSITQFAMEDIERLGLVKMDFLGLRTLTLIDRTVASIANRTGHKLDWNRVTPSDRATYDMLCKGETEGCFQLEGRGVKRVLRELRPSAMDDIIAVISLYRPGPMENIPTFIAAKHGRTPVRYPHPDLEPVLRDTYGVIVYQEQIMQIAAQMAGFSLGEADLLRKAVGKKKRDVLDRERTRFVSGCLQKGYDEPTAQEVYDLIVRFADYGYNRSHAAAYALLTYRTAYLRANFLPDFLTALLSMSIGNSVKEQEYIGDAKRHGITVLPPSVGESGALYEVASETAIRSGLLSVRNVGRSAVDAILEARSQQPFSSLVDFLSRVGARQCNRKAVESLLAANALDLFLPDRASAEVRVQLLEEAYREVEGIGVTSGLGLNFEGSGGPATRSTGGGNHTEALYIRYQPQQLGADGLRSIQAILRDYPGTTPVVLVGEKGSRTRLLDKTWRVSLQPELIALLEEYVGLHNVKTGQLRTHI